LFSKRVSGSIRKKVGKIINFNPLTITFERGHESLRVNKIRKFEKLINFNKLTITCERGLKSRKCNEL
jgi:hypothetical protein